MLAIAALLVAFGPGLILRLFLADLCSVVGPWLLPACVVALSRCLRRRYIPAGKCTRDRHWQ
jgi:hypothetical protein